MKSKPKRLTQLEVTAVRLRVAMEALEQIGNIRPRSRAQRYAASTFKFLNFCCPEWNKKSER